MQSQTTEYRMKKGPVAWAFIGGIAATLIAGFVVFDWRSASSAELLAVLEDAVGTFQKHVQSTDRRGVELFAETEEWFASDDTEWPFSFVNTCNALGLEVAYLRRGLGNWRETQLSHAAQGGKVIRFPFRRVNGTRHSVTGRPVGLRRSA